MSAIVYMVVERAQDGTTRFTRTDHPAENVRYISRRDEHGEIVNVPAEAEGIYGTYVDCKLGLHHFYDQAVAGHLQALEMERRLCVPEDSRRLAAWHAMMAESESELADAKAERATALDGEIVQIKREMERADREGFARMFGE
jgi:hypothetical protein